MKPLSPSPFPDEESDYSDSEIRRTLRRARTGEISFGHNHAALQNGNYSETGYYSRKAAELALANDLRYSYRRDLAAMERALEFIYERKPMTGWGIRAWKDPEHPDFYRELFTDAARPENIRPRGPWQEVNEAQNSRAKAEIRQCVSDHFLVLSNTETGAEIFFDPQDIAVKEVVSNSKRTVRRHMREMSEFKEMNDPRQEGRRRNRIVFEYAPEEQGRQENHDGRRTEQ